MRSTSESIAKVLIINHEQEALVLTLGKHTKYPEKSFKPDLPGGVVDLGESELEAVIRETKEECGITLEPTSPKLIYARTEFFSEERKSVTKLLYVARIHKKPAITLSWEHSDFSWVPLAELKTIALRPFYNEGIMYYIGMDIE